MKEDNSTPAASDANTQPADWQIIGPPDIGIPPYLNSPKTRMEEARRTHVLNMVRRPDGTFPTNWPQMAALMERYLKTGETSEFDPTPLFAKNK